MSQVIVIDDAQFESEVFDSEDNRAVLAYFWATWCGPCRLVAPSVQWIAENYSDRLKVVKLEVDPNPETVGKYKVEGVPALRLFVNNTLVKSHEGSIGKAKLIEWLDSGL